MFQTVVLLFPMFFRTRRLLKEGVVKSSGAAKVAQIVQRDDTKTTGGDSTGVNKDICWGGK